MKRDRAVLAVLVPIFPLLTACVGAGTEKFCMSDEIVTLERDGGSRCVKRAPGDKECPSGQVLLKNFKRDVEGCIEDDWDKNHDKLDELIR
jgi:hypothetical protein